MDTKQWNTLVNESIAACDMSGVIQQADNWLQQGFDYWKAWGALASSYAAPQAWLETAGGISKTIEGYMQDCTRIYGLDRNAGPDEALAAQKHRMQKTDAALEKVKAEKAALKRTLTQKEKTLKAQSAELIRHQKRLGEKEKEIEALQAKVEVQAERLILLEAAGKKEAQTAARTPAGASAPVLEK